MLESYASIYALGHKAIADLFSGPVVIEEKIDGSQFSMAWINGELQCRSKGQQINIDAPEKMFARAVEVAKTLPLMEGWVYRCEYLQSPKHNTLAYSRIPANHLVLWDVMTAPQTFLCPGVKEVEAVRLGIEPVPTLFYGDVSDLTGLRSFLDRDSVLGGCKIEGFVVKNYALFTAEKKIAVGKFVSESFKEKHGVAWKAANPGPGDFVAGLGSRLATEARWRKAIQHLREAGQLTDTPSDIGPLLKEIQADIVREEETWIRDELYKHFGPQILRLSIRGFPEFYKGIVAPNPLAVAA